MNLHAIANRAISAINPNEPCFLHKSLGQSNERGRLVSRYASGVAAELQLQAEKASELAHLGDNAGSIEQTRKAWISVVPGLEPLSRVKATGGDMVKRADGSWWLVTAVTDDFARAGWTSVRLALQVDPPNVEEEPEDGDG